MTPYAETFEAIGVANTVAVDVESALEPALAIARAEVDALDRACSRFRDDSELAAVNRAAGADVPVGPLLLAVVEASLRAAAATGGRVDPTVGPALRALGYDRDFGLVAASPRGAFEVRPAAGWRRVRVDRRAGTISHPERR
jgi:thiamine biosynthesis lipoprotein